MICDATEGYWEDLRGRRLLMTGGTGFFGRWLLESFLSANQRFDLGAKPLYLLGTRKNFALRVRILAIILQSIFTRGMCEPLPFPTVSFRLSFMRLLMYLQRAVRELRGLACCLQSSTAHATPWILLHRILPADFSWSVRARCMACNRSRFPISQRRSRERPAPCLHQSAYGEGKRASEALCAAYSSSGPSGVHHRPALRVCWPAPASRSRLCHRRLSSRGTCRPAIDHSRRSTHHAVLSVRRRIGAVALDDPFPRAPLSGPTMLGQIKPSVSENWQQKSLQPGQPGLAGEYSLAAQAVGPRSQYVPAVHAPPMNLACGKRVSPRCHS